MNLTPFIVTKMAHDIAGCAGAVLNTGELLALDAQSVSEVAPLLNESAQTLVVRLKFFRCIFGTKTQIPPDIAQKYVHTLSMPFQLKGTFETPLELGFVLAATDWLPRGGTLEKTADGFKISGQVFKIDPVVEAIFRGAAVDITPHTAIVFWLKEELSKQKKSFSIQVDETHVSFDLK